MKNNSSMGIDNNSFDITLKHPSTWIVGGGTGSVVIFIY